MSEGWSKEEVRRAGAYHEAGHAVVCLTEGHTVRYVSIATEGMDYEDICVSVVKYQRFPEVGRIPAPWEALGYAIETIAGNMAMFRRTGQSYPWDSWDEVVDAYEEMEELGEDPHELDGDLAAVREYCKAAALFGSMIQVSTEDELPESASSLPPFPRSDREAFGVALRTAEERVRNCWLAIRNVAEKLIDVGYLTGEEVREIVSGSEPFEE